MKELLLKNKKLLLVLLGVSLVSIVYLYSSSQKPSLQRNLEPTPYPTSATQIHSDQPAFNQIRQYQVSFSSNIDWRSFPANLNLYSAASTNENLNSIIETLIQKYNLIESPTLKNYWVSEDGLRGLIVDYNNQTFQLSVQSKQNLANLNYTLDQAISAAKLISTSNTFLRNLSINTNKIEYFQISSKEFHLVPQTDPSKANAFNIPYSSYVDSYPVYSGSFPNPPLQLLLGPNNFLLKLSYISQPLPSVSNPQTKPVLGPDQIKTALESGQGEILSVDLMDLPYKATEIPLITIADYQIEFRYNEKKHQLIPYFRFYGSYSSPYNPSAKIEIILPAVEL